MTAGTVNTGSGGGGSGSGTAGEAGGKGVVILSMPDANYTGTTTGSPTVATGVSGNTVLTPTNGVYEFSPTEPNVKFKAVSASNTSTTIDDSYIEIFSGAEGKGGSLGGRGTGSTFAGFNLPDGTYMVRANGGAQWLTYSDKTVVLTVINGVPSITGLTASNGIFSIPLDTKNFRYKLVDTDGTTALNGAWIDACLWDAQSSTKSSCKGEGTNQNGEGGASLANGTYKITVYPGSSSSKSPRTYDATVSSGVTTITGVTASAGVFTLQPAAANQRCIQHHRPTAQFTFPHRLTVE
jgi:hypothetical protein